MIMGIPLISDERGTPAHYLKRLVQLRAAVIVAELLTVFLATQFLRIALPIMPLMAIIVLHLLVNAISFFRISKIRFISANEFAANIVLDTLVLALFLYFSGGYTNPFVSLFLLPLVITASVLPQTYTWMVAGLTITCYTILMRFYVPLPQSSSHEMHAMSEMHLSAAFDQHVLGMWFSFLLSVSLVVLFVVHLTNSLRKHEQALTDARERALEDERLVALGTLATGAAHELGTPLATMAVLASDLKFDHPDHPEVVEKAEMLRVQLDRCKTIISKISASTGHARGEGGGSIALDTFMHQIIEQWQVIRPKVQLFYQESGDTPAPQILSDKTLAQAITNILNNAADASIDHVEVNTSWTSETLTIEIRDQGEGLSEEARQVAGTPFFTTKQHGQGLGLFLARGIVEKYGGTLELSNIAAEKGTLASMTLPISGLRV